MARPTKKQQRYKNVGRKLFDGKNKKEVLAKLEEAALIDAPVKEMCFYADISEDSYYRYINKNPEFRERIESLRQRLTLRSRQNIASQIETGNISLSQWMLERKRSKEFGETLNLRNDDEGSPDEKADAEALEEYHAKLEANRKKRSRDKARKEGEI